MQFCCMIAYHQIYKASKESQEKMRDQKDSKWGNIVTQQSPKRGTGDLLKQLPAITLEVKLRGRTSGNQMGAEIIARPE